MLKIFKYKYFIFQSCKNKHKKGKVGKTNKGKVVVANTWKHKWYSVNCVCVKIKYQGNMEKKVYKVLQELNNSNV